WTTGSDVTDAVADLGTVVLVGHSAGGNLALYAEARVPVLGTVALAPVTDVFDCYMRGLDGDAAEEFCGGTPQDALVAYEAFTAAAPHHRVTVLHGTDDAQVPIDMSRAYAAHTGTRLRELAATGHYELINPDSRAWPLVCAAITAMSAIDAAPSEP